MLFHDARPEGFEASKITPLPPIKPPLKSKPPIAKVAAFRQLQQFCFHPTHDIVGVVQRSPLRLNNTDEIALICRNCRYDGIKPAPSPPTAPQRRARSLDADQEAERSPIPRRTLSSPNKPIKKPVDRATKPEHAASSVVLPVSPAAGREERRVRARNVEIAEKRRL